MPEPPWPQHLIDLENLITLAKAARIMSGWSGKTVSPTTMWRWTTSGKSGLILPHVRLSRSIYTTEAALKWHSEQVTAAAIKPHLKPRKSNAEVNAELDDLL